MAADGVVHLVEDGPGVEGGFHGAEGVLDHPQPLVLQRHLLGGDVVAVGGQHPLAVEPGLGAQLLLVKSEVFAGFGLEVFAVALVADERLVAAPERLAQPRRDGLAVVSILARLVSPVT